MYDIFFLQFVELIDGDDVFYFTAPASMAEVGMDEADDDVDGFADELLEVASGVRVFLGQALDTVQALDGRVGMGRAGAAGMTGIPGFQHRIGSTITDFADDDTVRTAAHTVFQQHGHVIDLSLRHISEPTRH